jgi:hypothetical protein
MYAVLPVSLYVSVSSGVRMLTFKNLDSAGGPKNLVVLFLKVNDIPQSKWTLSILVNAWIV